MQLILQVAQVSVGKSLALTTQQHLAYFFLLDIYTLFLYCLFCLFSDLRLDTLSQILTMSNVRAHSRMMVVESCQGMLVGALLERMGGQCFMMFLLQKPFKHDLEQSPLYD